MDKDKKNKTVSIGLLKFLQIGWTSSLVLALATFIISRIIRSSIISKAMIVYITSMCRLMRTWFLAVALIIFVIWLICKADKKQQQ